MKYQEKNSIEYWKLIRIGKAKKILEDFNGAIEAYSKAIEIDKSQYNAYFFRGKIYSKIKNLKIFRNLAYCRLSLPFAILIR